MRVTDNDASAIMVITIIVYEIVMIKEIVKRRRRRVLTYIIVCSNLGYVRYTVVIKWFVLCDY